MTEEEFTRSRSHLDRARRVIPRGVTSAYRAALRPTPLAFVRAAGSRMTDVDGNEYIDYVAGYGPMLLGHQPPSVLDAVREQLATSNGASVDTEQLLQRVRAMIDQSEQRQQRELALRLSQVTREVDTQHQADLLRIQQDFGQQQEATMDYLVRTSGGVK